MKKILFITQGNLDHASSRIRAVQYFPLLKKNGYHFVWIPRIPSKKKSLFWRFLFFPIIKRINAIRILGSVLIVNYDILFIQRYFLPSWCFRYISFFEKKRVIFDFDDAIYLSDADEKSSVKTKRMICSADHVITSTTVLANYAKQINSNVSVITSPVDISALKPGCCSEGGVTVGWIGSEWTSKYLKPLENVFLLLQSEDKVKYLLVGCTEDLLKGIERKIVPWSLSKEAEYLSQMDIGIMPLESGEFEQGKGGYKLFQYMAACIPVVASPVGINTEIVEPWSNGFLCHSNGEWLESLRILVKDRDLRKKMGQMGRIKVQNYYSLEICTAKLIKVLNELYFSQKQL
ncbi:MAG TPA: glycosyltransferase family 4 protein [Petrimonas sp.]|nr:glycosyltransferase family 4 protein [Petrimonas sp.]